MPEADPRDLQARPAEIDVFHRTDVIVLRCFSSEDHGESAPHPPHRHGRLLRVGRAARRSDAARQAGRGRRQPGRPRASWRRRATRRGPSASAPRSRWRARSGSVRTSSSSGPTFAKYKAASQTVFEHLPVGDAARRAAVARRGLPRRHRERLGRAARTDGRRAAEAGDQGGNRADGVGRRRAEQVPGEDRVGVEEAGRPHGHRARAGRAVPPEAAGGCAVGGRPGDRRAASRTRDRASWSTSEPPTRRCCARPSAAAPTGCGGSPRESTTARWSRTAKRKSSGSENTFASDLTDLNEIRREIDEMARDGAGWLAKKALLCRTVTIKVRYSDFTTVTRQPHGARPVTPRTSRTGRSRCSTRRRPGPARYDCSARASTTCWIPRISTKRRILTEPRLPFE